MNGMSLRWRPLNATDRSKATKVTPQMTPDIWWNEFLFANKQAWNVEVDWDEFVAPTAVHSIVGSIHFRHISTGTWFTRAVKDLIEVRGDISVNTRYHGAIYLTRWSKKVWRILYQKLQLKHCRSYVSFMFMIYFQDSFSYACFSCMRNIQTFFFMKYKLFVLFVQFQSLQLVIVPISCQKIQNMSHYFVLVPLHIALL